MGQLLVSVRGPNEAIEAARGGAHIADVEYPASALGTPYPLNIEAVRSRLDQSGLESVLVSTNIGEKQHERASACQAAIGVATAGADVVKCGLADLNLSAASYQAEILVRSVRRFHPEKKVILAVFADRDLQRFFQPFSEGVPLLEESGADGLLVDTFNKLTGKGLMDYCTLDMIGSLADSCHSIRRSLWVAGSLTLQELPPLWGAKVDVVCVRGAACVEGPGGRFGEVSAAKVAELVGTLPGSRSS